MAGVEPILQLLAYLAALVGLLPLLPFLAPWVLALLALGFLLGITGDRRRHYLLSNRWATLLSIASFLVFLAQASFANLVTPLVQLLCVLLAVRLASEKSARHLLQTFLLATIVLAASSMLSLDIAYLFYLVLLVLLVTSGLVLLSFYAADPQLRLSRAQWLLLLKTMLLLPVGSLLLMLVLFVILPRTQTPLWNFLNPRPNAAIGMSDQVRPGSVAELAQSGEVAFRAEMDPLPPAALYWRGIVLNRLEGRTWKRGAQLAQERLEEGGESVTVKLYAEPKVDRYLVTLDRPQQLSGVRHQRTVDGVVQGRSRDGRKLSYRVTSRLQARSRQTGDVTAYLQLPEPIGPRLRDLAEQLRQGRSVQEKLDRLDRFFLQQQLSYSTERLPKTERPVETFLFDSKRGYCEYFASSYALLLRLAGVPARLVGGYLGGEYNRLGGYYLVGEDAAHVWVEALDDDGYWQRIDPSRLAVNAAAAFAPNRSGSLASLQAFADAMLHSWSRLVLNYDLRRQVGLIRDLVHRVREVGRPELHFSAARLWPLLLLLLPTGWLFWRRRKSRPQRLLLRYRKLLAAAAGVEHLPDRLGLFELAELVGDPRCREFAQLYGGTLYRDRVFSEAALQRLRVILSRLQQHPPAIEVAKLRALGDNERS